MQVHGHTGNTGLRGKHLGDPKPGPALPAFTPLSRPPYLQPQPLWKEGRNLVLPLVQRIRPRETVAGGRGSVLNPEVGEALKVLSSFCGYTHTVLSRSPTRTSNLCTPSPSYTG